MYEYSDLFPVNSSLDSALKKNTAFIKRLRTGITSTALSTFVQEIRTLSLHKYLSEIISALFEGLCKLKTSADIDAGVEIVCALHQRFGPDEFTCFLSWLLGKGMTTPDKSALKALAPDIREKEEKERMVRQRALLRVVSELWLVGVLRTLDDAVTPDDATKASASKSVENKPKPTAKPGAAAEPFPLEVLKDLLGHDREHVNLPLLVIFVKSFSYDILGTKVENADARKVGDEGGTAAPADAGIDAAASTEEPLTAPEVSERFRNILKRYFEDVKAHVIKDQQTMQSQARRNAEAYVKSGEVFEDRQANYEKQVKVQERLVANAQVLADAIGAEMPDLKNTDDGLSGASSGIGLVKTSEYLKSNTDGSGIWLDDEERRFYENLMDLKGKVPSLLLEDGKKKKADSDEQVGKKTDAAESNEMTKATDPAEDLSTAIANKTIGAQVDALLARLPELTNKDSIDQMAIDFCYLNSKASRNRLIKALSDVPKGRSDLLPLWARLAATLGRYMPDVPKGLVDYLDAEFRSLQRRKEKDFLGQVRLSNIRYLAELTKFGVVGEHVVFHSLKVSLDDFSRMNIEIMCNLIENCGRYLLKTPETAPRMATFLETLQRKKSVQHLGQPERMLIDNALYYVDPPERPAIEQKERTPMELFIRKIVYVDMTKRNHSKILKQIRRLHWEEGDVVAILEKVFSKPAKVKFGNIHLLATLLSTLYRHHPEFVVRVIDNVVESIIFGLEENDFRTFQRRIAEVKYLAELYNYRMLEHPVVFDTMYKILTFGHGGAPIPGRHNSFDPADDFFRVRLIATILDTCGIYFNRGAAGKKLDYFLSFFQYYIYTKVEMPVEMEFLIQDTFATVRPQFKFANDFDEATKAFQTAVAQDQKSSGTDKATEPEDLASDDSSDDGDADDMDGDEDSASEDEDEEMEALDGEEDSDVASEFDEAIVVTREEEAVDPEEEAEFEREYAKMMAESLDSRKFDRKPVFDVPLPVRSKTKDGVPGEATTEPVPPAGKMAFSLLTKKGNRQHTRTVELPSDSAFAVAMKSQQLAEREEQQRIKNLVLNYDMQQSEDVEPETDRPTTFYHNRMDRGGKDRGQRVRKLQLSDVDW